MDKKIYKKIYIILVILFFVFNFHLVSAECPAIYPNGMIACEDFEDGNYADTFGWDFAEYENLSFQSVAIINENVIGEYATISSPENGMKFLAGQWEASGNYNIPGQERAPISGNHQLRLQENAYYSGTSLNWEIDEEYLLRYHLRLSGASYIPTRPYTSYNHNDLWSSSVFKLLHHEYAWDNFCVQAQYTADENYFQRRYLEAYADTDSIGTRNFVDSIIDDGEWHKIEIYVKIGEENTNNVKIWIDDILLFDDSVPDTILRPREIGFLYNDYSKGSWNHSSPWYIDNLELWGDLNNPNLEQLRNGSIGEFSDTTPPSAPSGLSVS